MAGSVASRRGCGSQVEEALPSASVESENALLASGAIDRFLQRWDLPPARGSSVD